MSAQPKHPPGNGHFGPIEQSTELVLHCQSQASYLPLSPSLLTQTLLLILGLDLHQTLHSHGNGALSSLQQLELGCSHLQQLFHLTQQQRFDHEPLELRGRTIHLDPNSYNPAGPTPDVDTGVNLRQRRSAADVMQTVSSGQHASLTHQHRHNDEAAVIEQRQQCTAPPVEKEERVQAAVVIQACWRGVRLRRRLRHALAQAQSSYPGYDDALDSLEPLEMEQFELDEASLDLDWTVLSEDESEEPLCAKTFIKAVLTAQLALSEL
uniref:Uncharacterized protein n=1 Tax=Knipowitschia caucasica TaxID=637954 RepID=A0AAV2L094_KNICA